MKKPVSLLLAVGMLLTLCTPVSASGLSRFQKTGAYEPGQFSDVSEDIWYAENVKTAYEYGLMNGVSAGAFSPDGDLTVAQAIVVACRIHSAYRRNGMEFGTGDPWYQPYVDYARKNGIIEAEYSYGSPVSRLDFALFISNALPEEALPQLNDIKDNDIPDVYMGSPYSAALSILADEMGPGAAQELAFLAMVMDGGSTSAQTKEKQAVYRLYRAGLLTGGDRYGTFSPSSSITRAEAAAILSRTVEPSLRKQVTLEKKTAALVPVDQLANLPSVKERASTDQLAQAYEAARAIVEPLAGQPREVQLCGIALALRAITEENIEYSMESAHYADPYGFFVEKSASCAGCTRATGLCLNMLGISYEHVNENGWTHQWTRVNIDGVYWICDAYGLYCGPEQAPYRHPNIET